MKNSVKNSKFFKFSLKNFELLFIVFLLIFSISCSKKSEIKDFSQIEEYLVTQNFQGTVLIGQNGKILYQKGFGPQDSKNPESKMNSPSTIYEAGSLSKQITACAIMQLWQQGKIDLDSPVSLYFPDFVYGNQITIKMLLNMKSGLSDHINSTYEFFPRKIAKKIDSAQINGKPLEQNLVLKYLNSAPLISKPGSTYFYSNTNYYLLAKIVEKVSGVPYKDYIQQNIFDFCKMSSSNLNFRHTDAKGYDKKGKSYSIPEELAFGCGDLNTTAEDLFKWNTTLHSRKILNLFAYRLMTKEKGYTCGFYHNHQGFFHAGVTNGFNSYNAYYTSKKLSVIVLANQPLERCNAAFIASHIFESVQQIL
jgi:CubicO group peptidase (beta-lactamase class C family)